MNSNTIMRQISLGGIMTLISQHLEDYRFLQEVEKFQRNLPEIQFLHIFIMAIISKWILTILQYMIDQAICLGKLIF